MKTSTSPFSDSKECWGPPSIFLHCLPFISATPWPSRLPPTPSVPPPLSLPSSSSSDLRSRRGRGGKENHLLGSYRPLFFPLFVPDFTIQWSATKNKGILINGLDFYSTPTQSFAIILFTVSHVHLKYSYAPLFENYSDLNRFWFCE